MAPNLPPKAPHAPPKALNLPLKALNLPLKARNLPLMVLHAPLRASGVCSTVHGTPDLGVVAMDRSMFIATSMSFEKPSDRKSRNPSRRNRAASQHHLGGNHGRAFEFG